MEASTRPRMRRRVPRWRSAYAQSSRGNDRRGKGRTVVERSVHGAMRRARIVSPEDPTDPHATNPWGRVVIRPLSAHSWLECSRSVAQLFRSSLSSYWRRTFKFNTTFWRAEAGLTREPTLHQFNEIGPV